MTTLDSYDRTRRAAQDLWRRLETAQSEALKGCSGADSDGKAFRAEDARVRSAVADLWAQHDRVIADHSQGGTT